MSNVSFDFKAISDDTRDELLSDPAISTLPALSGSAVVTSDDPYDIDTEIQSKLNTIGLGILVLQASAQGVKPNAKGPYFGNVLVTVKVYENPTINRANANYLTAGQVATIICTVLHQFHPPSVNESFYVQECIPVADPAYNLWQVTLKTACGISYPRKPIAPVVATPAGPGAAEVVLTCATPGAAIFYTLDDTYPSPRNPSSQLYIPSLPLVTDEGVPIPTDAGTLVNLNGGYGLQPLAIAAGTHLRARAWLSGYAPPNPLELSVQY